ncbi:MAG: hypothetical protein ABSC94_18735, partial [Polyangiaceae bacterium]
GEFGYDSNWLLRSTQSGVDNSSSGNAPVIPALEFRVTPSLYLSTISAQRIQDEGAAGLPPVAFRAGINATAYELIGISSEPAASLNQNGQNDINQQHNIGGAAYARLDFVPQRPVGGALTVNYGRVILPNAGNANPNISFNQDNIGTSAEIGIQPNMGTLDWRFGYQFGATLFEQQTGQVFNNYAHVVSTQGRWRFRPRTALVYDATLGFNYYANQREATADGLVHSTPVRTRVGLNGLVTERFAVLAMAGWGATFNDQPIPQMPQYDSLIAQAELRWYLAASPGLAKATELGLTLSSIAIGYTRDFQSGYLGNYAGVDRGYLKFNYFFAGRALVSLEGGVGSVAYPRLFWLSPAAPRAIKVNGDLDSGGASFTDIRADATLLAEYRFTNTFGINTTLRYSENFSNVAVQEAPIAPMNANANAPPFNFFGMAWQRFEALIGLRWFM